MEDEKIKVDRLLLEKRHKETSALLKGISEALTQKSDDKTIVALEKQETAIRLFMDGLKNLPKPTLNHQEIVVSIQKMTHEILTALSDLKQSVERPKKTTMKIKRNFGGYISEIEITEPPR